MSIPRYNATRHTQAQMTLDACTKEPAARNTHEPTKAHATIAPPSVDVLRSRWHIPACAPTSADPATAPKNVTLIAVLTPLALHHVHDVTSGLDDPCDSPVAPGYLSEDMPLSLEMCGHSKLHCPFTLETRPLETTRGSTLPRGGCRALRSSMTQCRTRLSPLQHERDDDWGTCVLH